MRLVRLLALAAALLSTTSLATSAQPGGTFAGTVRTDSGRTLVADVAVILPALGRETRTDARGAFRFAGLPAGATEVVVRAVGFAPRLDTLTVGAAATVRDYVLARSQVELDAVFVRAERRRSPGLRGFEERRAMGMGRFVDEATLRQQEGRTVGDIIADRVPGLRVIRMGSGQFAVSTRSQSGPSGRAIPQRPGEVGKCYSDVYLDGVLVYSGTGSGGLFDLARWGTRDLAGIEYYAGGATIPAQFNRTSTGCGVLLLWSRES